MRKCKKMPEFFGMRSLCIWFGVMKPEAALATYRAVARRSTEQRGTRSVLKLRAHPSKWLWKAPQELRSKGSECSEPTRPGGSSRPAARNRPRRRHRSPPCHSTWPPRSCSARGLPITFQIRPWASDCHQFPELLCIILNPKIVT